MNFGMQKTPRFRMLWLFGERAVALALLAAGALVVPALLAAAATKPSPEQLQARYNNARDRVVAHPHDRRAWSEIALVERYDGKPSGKLPLPTLASLPHSAGLARAAGPEDLRLSRRLGALGRSFDGWAGFWVHDLSTGRTARWNSDARFPAASTVKLGVLAAALRRFGPHPERSSAWYDLRQLAAWSSNLAANRLVDQVGGTGVVEDELRRLGMWSSTYPGPYRAGSSLADAPKPPPQNHWRVTTAHDLGRALWRLQAGAFGNRYAQSLSGLTRQESELALRLLLSADPRGENAGLVRQSFPGTPIAQKNGWISDTRATAAVIYFTRGPKIAVVVVFKPDLASASARMLGRRFARLLG
jgi:beta-lactamase class A